MQQDQQLQQIQQMQQPNQQQTTNATSILGLPGMQNFNINTAPPDQSNQQQTAAPLKDAQQVPFTPSAAGSTNSPNVVPSSMLAAQYGTILSPGVNGAQGTPVLQTQTPVMANLIPQGLQGQPGAGVTTGKRSSQRQQKAPKAKVMPSELDIEGPTSNEAYQAALNDPT